MTRVGKVYLVGAGPGDPGLITVKGAECLKQADVVLYDHLVNETLLQLASEQCERIRVGKRKKAHTIPQGEINDLLVKLARDGKVVVRLKGGDPFVFGRGGEEALTLADNSVPFEVVPGVTAGSAAATYAGIPLTRRGLSSSVVLVTGHEDPTKEAASVDWNKIAAAADTIVIYMGRSNLPAIVESLLASGMSADKPAAAIQWGTTASQRTVTGSLVNIVERCSKEHIEAPAIVLVGDVVTLRDKLSWFEGKPLFGKRIMITRDRAQAQRTSAELERYGAEVIEFPTIRIMPLADYAELDAEIAELSSYDWAVFTSANGVRHFFARLDKLGLDTRAFAGVKVCAVGPATAEEAKLHGLLVDCIPQQYTTESLADELARVDPEISKKKVLLPRADIATDVLARRLNEIGADATEVDVYRVVPEEEEPETAAEALREGDVDIVLFTSSSTARNFARLTADAGITVHPNVKFATIGPVTTSTAEEIGYKICCEAEQHTIPCLIQTIISSLPQS